MAFEVEERYGDSFFVSEMRWDYLYSVEICQCASNTIGEYPHRSRQNNLNLLVLALTSDP